MGHKNRKENGSKITIHKVSSRAEFSKLNNALNRRGMLALDAIKPGVVRSLTLGDQDPSLNKATDLATCIGKGAWSNGPLAQLAWSFDKRDDTVKTVNDSDGNPLGLGYVEWGPGNCIPSTIPPLAQSLPYTAAPLKYIADLTSGLGPCFFYPFPDGTLTEFRFAGYKLLLQLEKKRDEDDEISLIGDSSEGDYGESRQHFIGDYVRTEAGIMTIQDAKTLGLKPQGISTMPRNLGPEYWNRLYAEWEKTWYGYDWTDNLGVSRHAIGAKDFLEENNLNLHLSQCMQDDAMLDIYFPTIGFDYKGTRGEWRPTINRVGFLPSHSTRLEKMDANRYIHHCYFSDSLRTIGAGTQNKVSAESQKFTMYRAAMPQDMLHELRYIVESGQKSRISARPLWVVCPTFYPSLNKPYYPQPAWWSVFTSKAFDFSSTILYDKAKQRENRTSWGKIIYISLDYLEQVFADEGYKGNKDKQQEFIDQLDDSIEDFLKHRENQGKMMRQWMWSNQNGSIAKNIEIVDVADATADETTAGKNELELSTSPIFLALQVDPRLVGVPMVAASNGGTALREMALLKQQQLNVKQRMYEGFMNAVARFNGWCGEWHIKQQTLTTLDNSKTGTVETISGEGA